MLAVIFRRVMRLIRWSILLLVALVILQWSVFPSNIDWYRAAVIVSEYQFDYLGWELEAIASKASQSLWGVHQYMDEAERSQIVRDYFVDMTQVKQLEAQIEAVYINPDIADPDSDTSDQRAERDTLRTDLRARQAMVEAIIEGQVASVLVDEGFGVAGQLLPPISMHFTQVPMLLIVSPRDEIRFDISINLDPIPVDEQERLESQVDETLDVASLIVPLGGMALYPAMILETANLRWAIETFAHEWLHHYLFLYPLGWTYDFDTDARAINETTADIVGKEIRDLVLQRYYPDLYEPPREPIPTPEPTEPIEIEPPAFDFATEMHKTRVTVDALLAEGDIEGAEAYMDERQKLFFENGYRLRKLNQAFFAFYGGYQAGGVGGVAGDDPIGPALFDLREQSASVVEFVRAVRGITTLEGLLAISE